MPAQGYFAVRFDTYTVSTTALSLTVTGNPSRALITVEANPIRYRLDGTNPTASVGHLLATGGSLELIGLASIQNFRMIRQAAADATVFASLQGG